MAWRGGPGDTNETLSFKTTIRRDFAGRIPDLFRILLNIS